MTDQFDSYVSGELNADFRWSNAIIAGARIEYEEFTTHLQNPGVEGFNRCGLYRMKEIYKDNKFVTPLVTQIKWTNYLLILPSAKTAEK